MKNSKVKVYDHFDKDKILKDLIEHNGSYSFIFTKSDYDVNNIKFNNSSQRDTSNDSSCNPNKCRTCYHKGLCDIQDGFDEDDHIF
jgi:hypothetical protein